MNATRAWTAALVLLATPGVASAAEPQPCLGREVGLALQGLVNAKAFAGKVPAGFRLERLDVKADHVEMGYHDDSGPAVTVLLTLPGKEEGVPVTGHGPHFEYRVVDDQGRASGPARDAMLRAAKLVDEAIPSSELRRCQTSGRAPAAFGLGVGAAEVAIVVAALALGVARRRRPPEEGA